MFCTSSPKLFRQLRISVSLMTKMNRKLKFHLKSRLSLLLNFQRVLRLQALRWTVDHFHIVNSNPLLFAQLQLLFIIQFLWLIGGKCFREYIRIISFVFHLAAAPQPTCRTLQRLALCSVSVFWSLAAPLASNRPPVTNLKPQHEVRIHRINQKLLSGNLGVNPKPCRWSLCLLTVVFGQQQRQAEKKDILRRHGDYYLRQFQWTMSDFQPRSKLLKWYTIYNSLKLQF